MNQYHKIQTVYKRDMANKGKIMEGVYSTLEIEYLKDNDWVFTEKVDGTNIRIMWNGENVSYGGKTDKASIPTFLLSRLQGLFDGTVKRQLFKDTFTPDTEGKTEVCFYGEGYGNKIQAMGKNYKPTGVDFVLIDIKIGWWWLERSNIEDIATKFGIKTVPIIGHGTLKDAVEMTKKGFNSQWGNFLAEGIVARPKIELKNRKGERIITKIKHKDFI